MLEPTRPPSATPAIAPASVRPAGDPAPVDARPAGLPATAGRTGSRPPHRSPGHARSLRVVASVGLVLLVLIATTGPAAAVVKGVLWPVQNLGDRGTDVLAIQLLLRDHLPADPDPTAIPPVDGIFGATTDVALKRFQLARGLPPTGIVTNTVWNRLVRAVSLGSTGDAVKALQRELVEKRRAAIAVDGMFGASTRTALLTFQAHVGMPRTGIADRETWHALVWHYELPAFTTTSLCDYSVGNGAANWGTAEAIATLEAAGKAMVKAGYGRVAVGDISLEHGGNIPLHESHERGLDVDVRPMRTANNQCSWGTRWSFSAYDRTATRALIKAFRALTPRHIKVIYFNDPVLIREGLTAWHIGHDDHLHVRFCEWYYPVAAYRC